MRRWIEAAYALRLLPVTDTDQSWRCISPCYYRGFWHAWRYPQHSTCHPTWALMSQATCWWYFWLPRWRWLVGSAQR